MPLLRTVGRTAVIAGTASTVSGRVSRRQQRKWSAQEQQQMAQQQAAPPPAAAPAAPEASMDDKVEQLKKLAELRDAGIITEQEFGAEKAKILG
jgi:hypothetical protein